MRGAHDRHRARGGQAAADRGERQREQGHPEEPDHDGGDGRRGDAHVARRAAGARDQLAPGVDGLVAAEPDQHGEGDQRQAAVDRAERARPGEQALRDAEGRLDGGREDRDAGQRQQRDDQRPEGEPARSATTGAVKTKKLTSRPKTGSVTPKGTASPAASSASRWPMQRRASAPAARSRTPRRRRSSRCGASAAGRPAARAPARSAGRGRARRAMPAAPSRNDVRISVE